jgi:SAM-dependent methyltransferase
VIARHQPAESSVSFDGQAADFDLRAGLPAGIAQKIAAAVAELVPAENGRSPVVLDLGAGTGLIGEHLARVRRLRYLGMDVSGPMLASFRRKLGAGARDALVRDALVRADAAVRWPIASGGVDLVFLSRAAHLLPPALLVEETLRVACPQGACVVFGGVKSEPGSLRAVLRRQMRKFLAEHGEVEGRDAGAAHQRIAATPAERGGEILPVERIAATLAERGGEILPVATAASWAVVERAKDALAAWRAKPGLGGRAVTPAIQDEVLRRLEDWCRERYGSLEVTRDATERYELAAIRLPKSTDWNPGGEECNKGCQASC